MKNETAAKAMKLNQAVLGFIFVLGVCAALLPAVDLFAQDASSDAGRSAEEDVFKAERERIQAAAEAAEQEQTALKKQIQQAWRSGDTQTADSLQAELTVVREKNIRARQEAVQNLKTARQKRKTEMKEARAERMDRNDDGTVDQTERAQFRQERRNADKDNNPPGPRGGAGTNWENRPGPQGGAGAGPNKGNQGVRDQGQGQGRDGRGQGGEKRIAPMGKNKP